jgi:hypothetical protein
MEWDSLVDMRASARVPLLELNASKRPLGTKLGTPCIRSLRVILGPILCSFELQEGIALVVNPNDGRQFSTIRRVLV